MFNYNTFIKETYLHTYGIFNDCIKHIAKKTIKPINVLYFSIRSGSRMNDHSQLLSLNMSNMVDTLPVKLNRSFSGCTGSPVVRRRILEVENM